MEVVNTKQFDVVFTFVNHPYFGVIVEANAVQLLENGKPSLTFQRIREKNSDYFRLDTNQKEAVQLIESFEVESIMKRFYTGTKRVRPSEFLLKHFTPEIKIQARSFIEKQLIKVLDIVKDYPLYWVSKTGEPMGNGISFVNEPATVLFHFRRDEEGMNYFVTIKLQDQKVQFYHNDSVMLVNKPGWLLTEDKLLFFNERIDGQKIKPFLQKKYIHIEPAQESMYMEKFVLPLLENHDVFAVGFDIVTEQLAVTPVLRLNNSWEKEIKAILYFKYGNWLFPYHVNKRVNVSLEQKDNTYKFHRIKRSYAAENESISILKELGLELGTGSLFSLDNSVHPSALVQWVNQHHETLIRHGFVVEQEFNEVNYFLGKIDLKIKVNQFEDWFDIFAVVIFGEFEIPFNRLKNNILQRKKEFVLPDGTIALIPDEWFSRFSQILNLAQHDDKKIRLKNIHGALLDDIQDLLEEELPKTNWMEVLDIHNVPIHEVPSEFEGSLRAYQLEGYNWMRFLLSNKFGALLADDMGLGKTIQTLAVVKYLTDEYKSKKHHPKIDPNFIDGVLKGAIDVPLNQFHKGPCLVICPKSLLYNWKNESSKFCPSLKVITYSGLNRHKLLTEFSEVDLVVMSYGTMRNDIEILRTFEYNCIVLDESQAIKNPSSQTSRNLLKLHSKNRLALTGTPIENTLMDIWSQMNFLNPGLLGSYTFFENQFIKPIEKANNVQKTEELKRFIDPFVLRRTKSQVVKELPPKIEKIHYCEMSPGQEELYEKIKSQYRNEILSHVNNVGLSKSRLKIFNGLMHLRQLALNPSLKDESYQGGSGKDDEIFRMVVRAIESNHKILLFSQFVGYLKNIGELLREKGIEYCYLDGSMDEKERASEIDEFQNNDSIKVFLLSLRAGNSGLNLTAADYVFLADPWWNPFTMKQAEDRAHRIGQERTVLSYKFITKNSIEEKILSLQQKKTKLAESIIPDEDMVLAHINIEELEELLN